MFHTFGSPWLHLPQLSPSPMAFHQWLPPPTPVWSPPYMLLMAYPAPEVLTTPILRRMLDFRFPRWYDPTYFLYPTLARWQPQYFLSMRKQIAKKKGPTTKLIFLNEPKAWAVNEWRAREKITLADFLLFMWVTYSTAVWHTVKNTDKIVSYKR